MIGRRHQENTGMHTQPVQEAVVSVFDLDRIVAPLTQVCGYVEHALPDAPPEQFQAWNLPPTCERIEQRLLVPGPSGAFGDEGRGALRLVRFHGVAEQKVMRSSQRSWDTGGIFDVDMFSADVDRVYRGLQRHGWTALGEPVDYSEAHFSVRQVVAMGPDGLVLAIIQRYAPYVEGLNPAGLLSPVFNSTQMVADFDAAMAFYGETLGFQLRVEFTVADVVEPGADVLGLPLPQAKASRRKLAMFKPDGPGEGGVELIQNLDMTGRRCDADCVAPNIGILCLRFEVADAPAYAAQIESRGGALHTPVMALDVAPFGPVTLFAVRSPEGAIIEFYSR
jgi:predicted enzyme related to lactoylglutathione lyase